MLVDLLIEALGKANVKVGEELRDSYYHIWKMAEPLKGKALVYPGSTEEVSSIMRICHNAAQPVIVFGGRTNLVGGTESNGDEVLISMDKMNKILEVDVHSRSITVESGVILENIQEAAKAGDLLFPLNFGAKGTAQIGGIISTNAGGLRVFRYGMTRRLVLGLEVVKADGTVVSSLKKIIKDNSGYDLKQLFIGSEGTLGIITKAVLKVVEMPRSRNSAFVALKTYEQVLSLLKYMDKGLAGTLSGFELMWNNYYCAATTPPAEPKAPLPTHYSFYVLLESMGSHHEEDKAKLQQLLEECIESGLVDDAALAYTESDMAWFWKIREDVHAIVSRCHIDQHFDISLPLPLIGETLGSITKALLVLDGVTEAYTFGHVADGNIHIIVDKENDSDALRLAINDVVYSPLKAIGGSVSAEHGIGLHKKDYLHLCRTDEEIEMMRLLKRSLDPLGILNPGKVV